MEALAALPTLANLPLWLAGCKVLVFPIGTTACCQDLVVAKVAKAVTLLEPVRHVNDGLLHFQLVCFCIQSKFGYLARGLPPLITLGQAMALDRAAVDSIAQYWLACQAGQGAPSRVSTCRVGAGAAQQIGGLGHDACGGDLRAWLLHRVLVRRLPQLGCYPRARPHDCTLGTVPHRH
eukprot:2019365-Rhodomonas_salina.1